SNCVPIRRADAYAIANAIQIHKRVCDDCPVRISFGSRIAFGGMLLSSRSSPRVGCAWGWSSEFGGRSLRSLLLVLVIAAILLGSVDRARADDPSAPVTQKQLDDKVTGASQKGDTAWLLVASAFVMFMLPGLALFYGGLVRRKNVLATMMHSMAALAVVGVYW